VSPGVSRDRRPSAGQPRPLRLPEFETFELSSGIEVWVATRHTVPEVSLRLILEAGATHDDPERAGVGDLTGRLLTEGAADRDARAMAEWIDRLGAAFHASIRYDVAVLSMHFLPEVTAEALDYLATVARHPTYDPDEVTRVRGERLDEVTRDGDEPAIVADVSLIAAVYEDHPYGRPADGLWDTVSRIDVEDVRAFHARRYSSSDARIVVCGDVEPELLRDGLEARFGDWAAATGRSAPPERPSGGGRPGTLLIDRPGSPQAELRIGAVGAAHSTPDQYAISMANAILGGLFNSRMNMNLREDKGWTYGARTSFLLRRGAGPFVARTAVETGVTADAIEEMHAEIRGMRETPPTDEEIALARNALTLSLPLQFETASAIGRRVTRQLVYDLPRDYWETYRARIEAVTRDDVLAACERYLHEDGLTTLVVADGAVAAPHLERLGPVEETEPSGFGPVE